MLSYPHRLLFVFSLFLSLATCCLADTPASKPTPKQIAQWIEQLGDNSFTVREDASKKLWQAGAAAESSLERALKSDDAEVVRRARELFDKFRWGIYPETPAEIVALIRAYQSNAGNARREVLRKLLDSGDAGLRTVLKIARAEKDENQRKILRELVAGKLPVVFLQAVTEEKYEKFEQLLELGRDGQSISQTQYAAYWLLRGKLTERIALFRKHLREHPGDKWSAQTLAYLHRANGDLLEARKAAEKSENAELIEGILYELGDWRALAARPEFAAARHSAEKQAEVWAYRAAFARLAGKQKEFDNTVRELQEFALEGKGKKQSCESLAFVAAKGLLLNDRPAGGLDLLRTLPKRRDVLFDVLCARLEFSAAIDLAVKAVPTDEEIPDLTMAHARLLCWLGDKEGEKKFDHFAERIEDGVLPYWVQSLLQEEMRAGLQDRAFAHAAKAMRVAPPEAWKSVERRAIERSYVAKIFPQHTKTAEVWWTVLRRQFKDESPAVLLKRLRELLDGKVAGTDVKAWIEQAEAWAATEAKSREGISVEQWDAWRPALAEAAIQAGLDNLASSLLQKTNTRDALLRLGDLLVAKKQWAKAAERYQQAWKKELSAKSSPAKTQRFNPLSPQEGRNPLPLYLAGDAFVHAGQEKEGRKLIGQAHWIPLASAAKRHNFFLALGKRGHTEAAQREADLLLRVTDPTSFHMAEAFRRRALAALKHKQYLEAADGFEESMLRCLQSDIKFVSHAAYANVPAQIHLLRARGLLAKEKLDEALKQTELALTVSPGYANLPIELVPELERRGHKKEATALFERCHRAYEKVCRDYPRCSWAHNSAAWMSACCRRNLDKALQHAEKAVELAPSNAGYLDTLAEVHFQRGDKDKAIALQKRAIELDPKKTYYRKQLKRLEVGDPSAERPPENDEE